MTTSREIRIFISSTFDDLVEERELLMKSVWLRLQQKCRRRGVELVFIDLRWGISAERKLVVIFHFISSSPYSTEKSALLRRVITEL